MSHRRSTPAKLLLALLAMVLVASACGSRLPDETLEAIDANITGGGSGGGGGSQLAAGGSGDATSGDAATSDGTTADAGTGDAGPATSDGATAQPGAATQPGATGGQTQAASGGACPPGNGSGPGISPKEIKVASIVTDSGPLPGATEGSYRGAAAYFAMVNSQGGVCGRKLTIVKGDDGLDPARARGEFLRLEPQIAGFVSNYAVADSGFIDLIDKTKVPYAGLTIDPSGRKLPSVFPKRADDKIGTGPYVWLAKQFPNVKKAAILYADVGGVGTNIDGTAKALQKAGFELVQPPTAVGVADPDYTGQVRNLQDKGAELVYLFAFEVNMHVRFNRNMRQQNFEPKVKLANIAFNDRFSQLLKTEGDGWINYNAYLPFLDPGEKAKSKVVNDFLTWNQRLFPGQQMDLFNVAGWGHAAYFVEALRTLGGNVTRDTLLKALNEVPKYNDGGLGVDIDPRTGDSANCFTMAKHEGGAWKRMHPADGFECNFGETFKFK
jgi:ABC-type branched-subunit amino acid transport system substrate-binding protein